MSCHSPGYPYDNAAELNEFFTASLTVVGDIALMKSLPKRIIYARETFVILDHHWGTLATSANKILSNRLSVPTKIVLTIIAKNLTTFA